MTAFSKRWDGTGPGIISGLYGDVYVDKDGYIMEAPFIFPIITRSDYVGPVRSDSEEQKVMGFQKFGTGDGQVLGEDKQPEAEEETPYRFSDPDENGTPQRLDVQNEDGSWTEGR